jgi:hypothetical protein
MHPPAALFKFVDERVIGSPHPLEEQVVAIEELAVLLQQVHGDGQHAPLHMRQPVAQLVQEGLKQVPGLGNLQAQRVRATGSREG